MKPFENVSTSSSDFATSAKEPKVDLGKELENIAVTKGGHSVFHRVRVPVAPGACDLVYCVGNVVILIEPVTVSSLVDVRVEPGADGRHDTLYRGSEKLDGGTLVSRRILKAWRSSYMSRGLKFYTLCVSTSKNETDIDTKYRELTIVSRDNLESKIEEFSGYADNSDVQSSDYMSFCSLTYSGYTNAELELAEGTAWNNHEFYPDSVDLDKGYELVQGIGARLEDSVMSGSSIENVPSEITKSKKTSLLRIGKADILIWANLPLITYMVMITTKPEDRGIWSLAAVIAGLGVMAAGKLSQRFKKHRFVLWSTGVSGAAVAIVGAIDLLVKGI